jgi:hypothetical protein
VVRLGIEGEADGVEEAGVAEEGTAWGPVRSYEKGPFCVQVITIIGDKGKRYLHEIASLEPEMRPKDRRISSFHGNTCSLRKFGRQDGLSVLKSTLMKILAVGSG